jgi:quercetin dioxygenase-like cupin family protein
MTQGNNIRINRLIDYVDYQPDSINKKVLNEKKTGKVTVFAFSEGQAMAEHLAKFDDIAYILDGEAEFNISSKVYQVKAGESIILPENQVHSIKAVKRFKMMLVMIKS